MTEDGASESGAKVLGGETGREIRKSIALSSLLATVLGARLVLTTDEG